MGSASKEFADRWEQTFGKKSATDTLRDKLKTDEARKIFDDEMCELEQMEVGGPLPYVTGEMTVVTDLPYAVQEEDILGGPLAAHLAQQREAHPLEGATVQSVAVCVHCGVPLEVEGDEGHCLRCTVGGE